MPGKFNYLLGGLSPETAAYVFDYARRYGASPTLADGTLVERLIAFGLAPPRPRCVLIHCWFAVSRSPAAALALACAAQPTESERTWVDRLRSASPSCSPNRSIVALSDTYLGRDGRLIQAVEEAGQALKFTAPCTFDLDLPSANAVL